jgi:hypothetical protein
MAGALGILSDHNGDKRLHELQFLYKLDISACSQHSSGISLLLSDIFITDANLFYRKISLI